MAGYNSGVKYGSKPAVAGTVPATHKAGAATTGSAEKKDAAQIYKMGLWAPTREGSKALATVQVREDITIPAGSYLNLYKNEEKLTEKSPDFSLQVRAGVLKTK